MTRAPGTSARWHERLLAPLLRGWRAGSPASTRLIDRLAGPLDESLRVLFDEAAAGVLVVDRSARIVRANAVLRRMVSTRVDLAPGRPAIDVFDKAERDALGEALHATVEGVRPPGSLLSRVDASDPDPDHAVSVSIAVLREAGQTISGLILHITDLTIQKRLEAQLAHGRKLQAIGQLAGGIAHDFNNLLTAVLSASEMILSRPGIDPDTAADVTQIRRSAERGAGLVRQLLAFGRQQRLEPRVVEINEAIRDLSDLLRRLLGSRIRLTLALETPGRTVRVDPTQLDQVLVNLAVNARDAMPEGGRLTLRSGHVTLYRPLARGQETVPPGRYVMVEVEDTGAGIPPEILPRIFDPFFTTKREQGGSGLGLSTVHGIVRQSEGFLSVDTELGTGTRFRLYLPRHDTADEPVLPVPPAPVTLPAPVPPPTACPGARAAPVALLVDDDDAVRRLAERALTQRGWDVLAADCGEAALALIEGRRPESGQAAPSVLISDVVMPGMDGPALVEAVRATYPGLPAILVSGYAEETLRRDCHGTGILFISKPYTLKDLLESVERVAGGADAPRPAS